MPPVGTRAVCLVRAPPDPIVSDWFHQKHRCFICFPQKFVGTCHTYTRTVYTTSDEKEHAHRHKLSREAEARKFVESNRQHFSKLNPEAISKAEVVMLSTDRDNRQLLELMRRYVVQPLSELSIADAYACLGGNTVYFAENFKSVRAYEVIDARNTQLQKNCENYNNVTYFSDCLDEAQGITAYSQDVVFLDPPWGPKPYQDMFDDACRTCALLLTSGNTEFVFLKVPLQHDNPQAFSNLVDNMRQQGWQDVRQSVVTRIKRGEPAPTYTIICAQNTQTSAEAASTTNTKFHTKNAQLHVLMARLRLLC